MKQLNNFGKNLSKEIKFMGVEGVDGNLSRKSE